MAASIWESSTLDGDYLPKPWTIRLKRIEKKRSTCPGWTRLVPKSSNVFSRSTHEFLRRREGTRLFAQGIPAHQLGLLLGVESRRRELIFLRSLSKARIVRGQSVYRLSSAWFPVSALNLGSFPAEAFPSSPPSSTHSWRWPRCVCQYPFRIRKESSQVIHLR